MAGIDSDLSFLSSLLSQLRSIPGLQVGIDSPSQLLKLITGEKATLFSYTLSVPQEISVNAQQQLAAIPVSPETLTEIDIYANLGVSVSATLTFGFDTPGFQAGNLTNGFFIQNDNFTASLSAGLSSLLNEADLAGYEVTGAVTGTVMARLRGANSSGKLYANQIQSGGVVFSAPNWNFGLSAKALGPQQMLTLAIQQFGPYLKSLLGTDYQIAANLLSGNGISFEDIAIVIGTAAKNTKNTLTAAGSGDDVVIGNGSSDTLTDTGSGMNVLIGGGGGDTLTGNGNESWSAV